MMHVRKSLAVCSMGKNVLKSQNGCSHQHSPALSTSCWLAFAGVVFWQFNSQNAKLIPRGPGSCRGNTRGSRERLSARKCPRTWVVQTELILILQMHLQLLRAKSNFSFRRESYSINWEKKSYEHFPLICR